MAAKRRLACSFCGRDDAEVAKLVAGPRVYICDRCVAIASRLMEGPPGEEPRSPQVERSGVLRRIRDLIGRGPGRGWRGSSEREAPAR
jgi:ATP-dependent Clp protease ATP-binding subunit ClpX